MLSPPRTISFYWGCIVNILLAYPRLGNGLQSQEIAFRPLIYGEDFWNPTLWLCKAHYWHRSWADLPESSHLIVQCLSVLIWNYSLTLLLLILLIMSTNNKTVTTINNNNTENNNKSQSLMFQVPCRGSCLVHISNNPMRCGSSWSSPFLR